MSSIFKFLILFGYLLGWRIIGPLEVSHLTAILVIGLKGINLQEFRFFLFSTFPALVYVLLGMYLSMYLWGYPDVSMLFTLLRLVVMFAGALAIIKMFNSRTEIYTMIIYVFNIHSILMILMFISPPLRSIIYDLTQAKSIVNNVYTFNEGYRISGLTYGLAITSIIHATIIVFLKHVKSYLLIITTILLNTSAVLLSGRSGIIILILSLLLLVKFRSLKSWIFLLLFTALIVYCALHINYENSYYEWLKYSFSEFKNISNTGRSATLDYLMDMFFFPDFPIILFGYMNTSRFLFGSYLDIDMGVVRWIWSYGIIGSILLYLPYLLMFVKSIVREYDSILLYLFVIFFLAHFKEEVLYSRINIYLLFTVYAANFYNTRKI